MTDAVADIIAKLIDSLKKLFSFLTWGRIAMMMVLLLLAGMTTAFWENRPVIYGSLTAGDKFSAEVIPELSDSTKSSIRTIVQRHNNIVGIQVVKTDFRNNVHDTIFFHSEIERLQQEYDGYEISKTNSIQIFQTGNTDQNERMIKIIEQEFVCIEPTATMIMMIPSITTYVKQVCSISVPPRYGKMVGFVNILLTEPIDRENIPYYKGLARSISDEIYDRDVMKGRK